MKSLLTITFVTFINLQVYSQKCSCDSICYCETLVKDLQLNWTKWVQNSDTIQLVDIIDLGFIRTEANKQKYIELLTADTAWTSHPAMGRKVYLHLLRYDSIQGKDIQFYDSTRKLIRSYTTFPKRDIAIMYLNKSIKLTDRYYEIYFRVNNNLIMSPTICMTKQYVCTGFLDNILEHLNINKH